VFCLGDKMDKIRAVNVNPIVLAFVGDAVYSLFVREKLVFESDYKTGDLNKMATAEVKAKAQAELVSKLINVFTEEEINVYKRARNSKKPTKAKSASVAEYNMATGFEAVLGYLYLIGNVERINFLLNAR
jgi:ribonuclease-3 family protein